MTASDGAAIETLDLFSPDSIPDPYPVYRRLRAADPVHWHERFGAWVLTRYDDVTAGLHDHARLSSARSEREVLSIGV